MKETPHNRPHFLKTNHNNSLNAKPATQRAYRMSSSGIGREEQDDDGELPTNAEAREIDVLFGRGSVLLFHPGNVKYRSVVKAHQAAYASAPRDGKKIVAELVVNDIVKTGARFLKRTEENEDVWMEVSRDDVMEKVKQSLREKQKSSRSTASASGGKRKAQEPPFPSQEGRTESRSKVSDNTPRPTTAKTRSQSDSETALIDQAMQDLHPPQLERSSTDPSMFRDTATIADLLQSTMSRQHQLIAPSASTWLQTNNVVAQSSRTNLQPTATVAQLLLQQQQKEQAHPSSSNVALQQLLSMAAATGRDTHPSDIQQPQQFDTSLPTPASHLVSEASSAASLRPSAGAPSHMLHPSVASALLDFQHQRQTVAAAAFSAGFVARGSSGHMQQQQHPLSSHGIDDRDGGAGTATAESQQSSRYDISSSNMSENRGKRSPPKLFTDRPTASLSPIRRRQQQAFEQAMQHLKDDTVEDGADEEDTDDDDST